MNAAIVLPERVRRTRAQPGPDMSDKDQQIQALKERVRELEQALMQRRGPSCGSARISCKYSWKNAKK
jgi:uncharacterized protein YbbK (DUF523 family)